jgi:FKBP-type peptidyl-prolyl cis-trans isomerase
MNDVLKKILLLSCLSVFLFASLKCNHSEEQIDEQKLKEHLMNANRIMVKDERKDIEGFLTRHNWQMDSTGTGLRYMIYENGKGKAAFANDSIFLTGKIFLLDATLCYEYKQESPFRFLTGHKDVPRGIEEAALLMKEGDKGRFVIPAHLGYGMLGDRYKIPGNSALYVELELLSVKPNSKN